MDHTPKSKLSTLREMWARHDFAGAIKMAAKFPNLGAERDAILAARDALNNPRFVKQLGKDPVEVYFAGQKALDAKFNLSSEVSK